MSYISSHKQSFGSVAKIYKKYRGSYPKGLYEKLFALARKKNLAILDLGCGVGNSTEPILSAAKKNKVEISLIGCDPDAAMLAEARKSAKKKKLPIEYVQGSAEKLPFKKEEFDVIISGAAFHWFATAKAMREIRRVLKPGGMYFVFWTQSVLEKKPVIGQELYKKYGFKGIPKELRDQKHVRKLIKENGFLKTGTFTLPFIERKTIDEALGLIQTNSGYAVLSEKDRKDFLRAMRKEHMRALGKRKLVVRQELRACYGFVAK